MWYPNIKLSRRIRLSIMTTLIASFFIISPLILLYTAGYRFDLYTWHVRQTGVITIDAEPTDATVLLQNIRLDKSIPVRLPNRAPGFYKLVIEREGYLPWHKTIQVESKQTTYATDIFLFTDALPTFEHASLEDLVSTTYSPDGQYVVSLLMQDSNAYEVVLYDITLQKEDVVWRGETEHEPTLVWSLHAPLLAILVNDTTNITIETIDATNSTDGQTYIVKATSTPTVQWHEHGNNILYVQAEGDILALSNGSTRVQYSVTSSLWFVDSNADVWSISNSHELFRNEKSVISHVKDEYITDIIDTRSTHLLARGKNDIRLLWFDTGETTIVPASNMFPRTYGKNWSTWILWSEWEVRELVESGDVTLLTRTNQPLQDVSASTKHETLFFAFENHINAFHPHYRTTHTLFEGNEQIKNIATQKNGDYIIFDTSINGKSGTYKRTL
jgi:hypothetical protein